MVRIVKNPEVRRLEIIQAAKELFEREGYANTSVESIIKKSGIAKGTFYHYFKAKKEVLDALVDQISAEMEAHFCSIVENQHLTAIQKLRLMLRGSEKNKIVASVVMEIIEEPENRELQEKLTIQSVNVLSPLLANVFEQGKQEGIFALSLTVESIQLILAGSEFMLNSGLFSLSTKKRDALLTSIQHILELMAGAKSGTLSFISSGENHDH